jgi:hypothetical protein
LQQAVGLSSSAETDKWDVQLPAGSAVSGGSSVSGSPSLKGESGDFDDIVEESMFGTPDEW